MKNPEIEFFRIVSIFGIVWFHSKAVIGKEVGYGGLIFFTIVSTYFATVSSHKHSFLQRMQRLIVPWFVWYVFYGIVLFVRNGHIYPERYNWLSMVLATPAGHLWFLPFIFFILIIIDNVRFLFNEWFAVIIGLSAIMGISSAPIWRGFSYVSPLGQYAQAMPAVLIGVFLGLSSRVRLVTRVLIIIGIVFAMLSMAYIGQAGMGITYIVGLLPCIFLFYENVTFRCNKFLLLVSSSTFGVYLVHIFVRIVLKSIGVSGYLFPISVFILSLLFVLVFRGYAPQKLVKYIV